MMDNKQICRLYGEAANYTDPDEYVSEMMLSSILLDPDNPGQAVDMELADPLNELWHVSNDPFKSLLARMGINQTQCSTRFCIPLRTVQGWALGERTCPPYVRLMMAEAIGILDIRG